MKQILSILYHNQLFRRLVPTLVYCLQNELKDCSSVLDLGCGDDSPLQYCSNIKESVGVEIYKPYLEASKKKNIHSRYFNNKLENLDFPEKSFDCVMMIDVLEHLPKKTGQMLLVKATKWAKKKVIITTPNGFVEQGGYDKNTYQKHLSGWGYQEMKNMGFKVQGLAGVKFLRMARHIDSKDADLTTSIRFKPRLFWFIIASLSQTITYHYPSSAFELFCVKRLK